MNQAFRCGVNILWGEKPHGEPLVALTVFIPYDEATESRMTKDILAVAGLAELTWVNSKRFRRQVCASLNGHSVVEIDLSRTTSIDCAGLGALLAIRDLIRARAGVVRLLNPSPPVQQLLDLVRAGQVFEIIQTSRDKCPLPATEAIPKFSEDENAPINPLIPLVSLLGLSLARGKTKASD